MAKKLYRSRKDRKIAGVCGGLAEYLNVDPNIIRLITVIFILMVGVGLIVYIVAWIIIPEKPDVVSSSISDAFEAHPVTIK